MTGRSLGVTAALLLILAPTAARAATQTRDDPSDAPAGALGKADLRTVVWDVSGALATLTVGVDESTYGAGDRASIGVHVLLDSDGDAIADNEIAATRNADGVRVDLVLRDLDRTLSTADCQDLAGAATAAQGTVIPTVANGRETFAVSFDRALVPGGLAAFRWAAFGQAPADGVAAGPWDVMPDAANPDSAAANPGDRRCNGVDSGLSVRMSEGVAFPDPLPAPPVGDSTPPQTTITKQPKKTLKTRRRRATARFEFASTEPGSSYECAIDDGSFAACGSPAIYRLKSGRHTFKVVATDAAGNRDASPATASFKVVRKPRRSPIDQLAP